MKATHIPRLALSRVRASASRSSKVALGCAALMFVGSVVSANAQTITRVTREAPGSSVSSEFTTKKAGFSTVRSSSRADLIGSVHQQTVMQWDDTAENGYSLNTLEGEKAEFVQLLTMPENSGLIGDVRVCFFFDQPVNGFTHEITVYRNNNQQPGTAIDAVEFFTDGQLDGEVCLEGDAGIAVNTKRVFVGVRYEPPNDQHFLAIDENGPNTSPGFARIVPTFDWEPMNADAFSEFRNIALDLEFTGGGTTPPPTATCKIEACIEDDETVCILNNRFKVKANFENKFGESGPMKAGNNITSDTGYLHFPGTPQNVEIVVKAIDACVDPFNRYWFFGSGLTDQGISLSVCDTVTGEENLYSSPLGTDFVPITDNDAFDTCP